LESQSRILDPSICESPTYPDQFLQKDASGNYNDDQVRALADFTEPLLRQLLNSHYRIAKKVKEILEINRGLENMINLLGEDELKEEDKYLHWRATRMQRFFSQPFKVSEVFSGIDGVKVPIWDTLYGFLCLTCDDINKIKEANDDDFWNKGLITDVDTYGKMVQDIPTVLKRLLPEIQKTS
jgi:F0F1-type ATP synthase beta subunit